MLKFLKKNPQGFLSFFSQSLKNSPEGFNRFFNNF